MEWLILIAAIAKRNTMPLPAIVGETDAIIPPERSHAPFNA